MNKRSRIDSSILKSIAAASLGALAVIVVAGSLWTPAGAQTQPTKGTGGPKIAAIKACAEKSGITLNSLAALKQLTTAQRTTLKQCLASSGITFGGPKIAAIKACAEKSGITLNSLAALKQLTPAQRTALKQCVEASRSGGSI
jgi:predicted xylose isomerase-like sugar epimerase